MLRKGSGFYYKYIEFEMMVEYEFYLVWLGQVFQNDKGQKFCEKGRNFCRMIDKFLFW